MLNYKLFKCPNLKVIKSLKVTERKEMILRKKKDDVSMKMIVSVKYPSQGKRNIKKYFKDVQSNKCDMK